MLDKDTFAIVVPSAVVLGTVTVANIEMCLKLLMLVATLAYTLWKWHREATRDER